MKKISIILASILFSVLVLQTCQVQASVIKPCSKAKLNKVVKDLKCQKVGSVYRWVKITTEIAVKEPKETPIKASTTETTTIKSKNVLDDFVAWSTSFNIDRMVLKSNDSWDKWEKQFVDTPYSHELIIDSDVPKKVLEIIEGFDLRAGIIVSTLIKKPTYTLVGKSCDWVNKKIKEIGIDKIPNRVTPCEETTNHITYMHNNNNFVAMIVPLTESTIYQLQTPGGGSDIAHEYFHGVQINLVGKVGDHYNNTGLPQWFLEGSASYFAYSVWCRANNKDCLLNNSYMIVGQQHQPTGYTHGLADYTSTLILRDNPGYKYSYDIGYRAIQYLSASSGTESILEIMKDFKKSNNFSESFKKITTISLLDFYEKFDQSRNSINFPPLVAKK